MAGRFTRLYRVTVFRQLVVAHGLATLGQLQLTMAVGVAALARTGSGVWVSVAVALGFLPYLFCSVPAGYLADRVPRTALLRSSIGLRVLTAGACTAGLLLEWSLPLTIGLAAITAVLATPSYPAVVAATPQVIGRRDLAAANTLVTGIENLAWVIGPGLLGLVLLAGAPAAGGGIAATAFLAAAFVALGRAATPLPASSSTSGGSDGFWAGFHTVRNNLRIRWSMILAGIDNFLYGYLVVAIVLVAEAVLASGERGVGWLNTSLTIGALVSMLVTWRIDHRRHGVGWVSIGLVVFAGLVAGAGASGTLVVTMLVVAAAGLLTMVVEVLAVTLIQDASPQHLAGRVFGVYDSVAVGLIALGSLLAGVLADSLGVTRSMAVVGVATAVLALGAGSALHRQPAPLSGPLPQ